MRRFFFFPILVLCSFSPCLSQPIDKSTESSNITWTDPTPVVRDSSRRSLLFNVNIGETDQGIFIFGNTTPRVENPDGYKDGRYKDLFNLNTPSIVIGPDGQRIDLPEGPYTFAYPRAVGDSSGTVHLLWAKPDVPFEENPNADFTTIWYARYSGNQWSEPIIIYKAHEIDWRPESTSTFFVDDKGVFHLLFTTNKSNSSGEGIMHLYRNKIGWHEAYWTGRKARACIYVDLAVNQDGRLLMACVGPDENSIFFTYSDDHGKNWADLIPVSRSGPERKRAFNSRIVVTSDGTIHLVWTKSLDGGIPSDTIWHAFSRDGGQTWSTPIDLKTAPFLLTMDMAADPVGHLHLVYSSLGEQGYDTYYRMWDGHQWTPEPGPLHSDDNLALAGEILLTREGQLYLVANRFRVTDNSSPFGYPVNTVYMIGQKAGVRDEG